MSARSKASYTLSNLHDSAKDGNKKKLKQILKAGFNVDAIDNSERTALFHSVFYSRINCAQYLLKNGANPNHRDCLGATPLHIAGQNCNSKMLMMLIEAGGDIRLHDKKGDSMVNWINKQIDVKKRKNMLVFLEQLRKNALGRCMGVQNYESMFGRPEIFDHNLRHESISSLMKYKKTKSISCSTSVHSDGFGKLCVGDGDSVGAIASIPIINTIQLKHDEFGCTYDNGPFCVIESMLWIKELVSVKRLHQTQRVGAHVDLLITELDYMRKLHHPCILLLMGICQTENLNSMILVYERVGLGSLYSILYQKLEELTRVQACIIMRNIANGLLYLHRQNMLHCAVNSHSIHLVQHDLAKLSNFEYMIQNDGSHQSGVSENKYMNATYNWMPPELILKSPPSEKSDLYGFCAVLWEILHGELPWKCLSPSKIEQEVRNRCNNSEEPLLPVAVTLEDPFNVILKSGLQWGDSARLITLEQARDNLVEYVADQTRLGDSSRNKDGNQCDLSYKRTPHRNIKFMTTEQNKEQEVKPLTLNMNISQMDEKIDKIFEEINIEETEPKAFISPLDENKKGGEVEKLEKIPPIATRRKFISSDKDLAIFSPREDNDCKITCDKVLQKPVEKSNLTLELSSERGISPDSDYCFIKNPAKKSFFEDLQNIVPPLPLTSPPAALVKLEKRTSALDLTKSNYCFESVNLWYKESQDFSHDMRKELQLETEEYLKKQDSNNWSPETNISRSTELANKINKLDYSNIIYKPFDELIAKPLSNLSSQDIKPQSSSITSHIDKIISAQYSNKFKTTANLFEKHQNKHSSENLSKSLINSHYRDSNINGDGYVYNSYNSQDLNEMENKRLNISKENIKLNENGISSFIEGLNRNTFKTNLLEKYKEESNALRNTGLLNKLTDGCINDDIHRPISVFSSESQISQTSSSNFGLALEPKVICSLMKKNNSTQTHEHLKNKSELMNPSYEQDNSEQKNSIQTSFGKIKHSTNSKMMMLQDPIPNIKTAPDEFGLSEYKKEKSHLATKVRSSQTDLEITKFNCYNYDDHLGIEKPLPNPISCQKLNNQMAFSTQNNGQSTTKNSKSDQLYDKDKQDKNKFININPKSYAEMQKHIKESAYKFAKENMFNSKLLKNLSDHENKHEGENFQIYELKQSSLSNQKPYCIGNKEAKSPNNIKINTTKPQDKINSYNIDLSSDNRSLSLIPVVEPEILKKTRHSNAAQFLDTMYCDNELNYAQSKLSHNKHLSPEIIKEMRMINNDKINDNSRYELWETTNGINKYDGEFNSNDGYENKGVDIFSGRKFQKMKSSVIPKNQKLLLQKTNYNKFSNSMSNIEDHSHTGSKILGNSSTTHIRGIRPASHHYPCHDIKPSLAYSQRDNVNNDLPFHDTVNTENNFSLDGNIKSLVHNFENISYENERRNSILTLRKNTTFINNDLSALALATPPMEKKSNYPLNKRVCVTPISDNFTQRIKKNEKFHSELKFTDNLEKLRTDCYNIQNELSMKNKDSILKDKNAKNIQFNTLEKDSNMSKLLAKKNILQPYTSSDGSSSIHSASSTKYDNDNFVYCNNQFNDKLLIAQSVANGIKPQNTTSKILTNSNSENFIGYKQNKHLDQVKNDLEPRISETFHCLNSPAIPFIDDLSNNIRISARNENKSNIKKNSKTNFYQRPMGYKSDRSENKLSEHFTPEKALQTQWSSTNCENMPCIDDCQSICKNICSSNEENMVVDIQQQEGVKTSVKELTSVYENICIGHNSQHSNIMQTPKKDDSKLYVSKVELSLIENGMSGAESLEAEDFIREVIEEGQKKIKSFSKPFCEKMQFEKMTPFFKKPQIAFNCSANSEIDNSVADIQEIYADDDFGQNLTNHENMQLYGDIDRSTSSRLDSIHPMDNVNTNNQLHKHEISLINNGQPLSNLITFKTSGFGVHNIKCDQTNRKTGESITSFQTTVRSPRCTTKLILMDNKIQYSQENNNYLTADFHSSSSHLTNGSHIYNPIENCKNSNSNVDNCDNGYRSNKRDYYNNSEDDNCINNRNDYNYYDNNYGIEKSSDNYKI